METQAYQEGQQAFYDGKDSDANPYHEVYPEFDDWLDGYIDADAQESGEFEPADR